MTEHASSSTKSTGGSSSTLLVILSLVVGLFIHSSSSELTLTVLHTNDVHSRFLETDKFGGACPDNLVKQNKCYGGFARLHYKVNEIRASHKNVVYLSGGDYFQGTVWYTLKKWMVVAKFVNILNHTAMALGNHEFDDNVAGLVPFLEAATFPIISCNLDDSLVPTMQGKYSKSIVVEVEGRKVGIIGFTTEETAEISNPGDVKFKDVIASINEEAERLHREGVNILIAVGHAGYDVDQKIAKQVPLIDAVVGGHTNTFLYHGKHPDTENPTGDYPTIVEQPSGKKVPVVQAYAYGKYLGYLNLTFNDEGEVTGWDGNPILLDGSIPQDPDLLAEIEHWGKDIKHLTRQEVGKTRVFLNGSSIECRLRECNLGSFIADAMVWGSNKYADELAWSDVTMAILNGGGVRGSIDERSKQGSITTDDILTVLPFQNTIDLIDIKGKHLREAFEFSVKGYDPAGHHLAGKFLQVSGIKVVYDISKPEGSRVKKLEGLCRACRTPVYEQIDDEEVYRLAIPTYTATGGDGFSVIKNNLIKHHISGTLDSDMLIEYIKVKSPIIQSVEGRITFEKRDCTSTASLHAVAFIPSYLSAIAFSILLSL